MEDPGCTDWYTPSPAPTCLYRLQARGRSWYVDNRGLIYPAPTHELAARAQAPTDAGRRLAALLAAGAHLTALGRSL